VLELPGQRFVAGWAASCRADVCGLIARKAAIPAQWLFCCPVMLAQTPGLPTLVQPAYQSQGAADHGQHGPDRHDLQRTRSGYSHGEDRYPPRAMGRNRQGEASVLVSSQISRIALTMASGRSMGIMWPLSGTMICLPLLDRRTKSF
jgi:hypothetical protein